MRFFLGSFKLLLAIIPLFLSMINAEEEYANYTNVTLVDVSCPTTQTIFTALTEMVLEGRSEMLSMEERLALNAEFRSIYNGLTQANCDGYFRRLVNLTFVNMTNDLGDALVLPSKKRQRELETLAPSIDANRSATRLGGVDITYEVTGTCRECPVTRAGNFQLYDDTFRRRRALVELGDGQQYTVSMRVLEVTSVTQRELPVTEADDCQCVEESLPDQVIPRAPGVQECVDAMNVKFDNLRDERGLFEGLNMSDLLQLDDLAELDDNSTFGDDTVVAKTPGGEDGGVDDETNNIWGRNDNTDNNQQDKEPSSSSSYSSSASMTSQHIGRSSLLLVLGFLVGLCM